MNVFIIDTGVANTASMRCAFERLGAQVTLTSDPAHISQGAFVVLPGVGSFESGMTTLNQAKLAHPLRDRIQRDKPTLAVCLGLQMLCSTSEENPGVDGLGVVDGRIVRFPHSNPTPQLGWNDVTPASLGPVTPGVAYFANSYCLRQPPPTWNCATSDYGGRFVSALWKGRTLACQFHPELSGAWGRALLTRWLTAQANCKQGVPTC